MQTLSINSSNYGLPQVGNNLFDFIDYEEVIDGINRRLQSTVTNGNIEELESEIIKAYLDSQKANDGYFLSPINKSSAEYLLYLLSHGLPRNSNLPEISFDRRGFLGLDWISDDNNRIAIVIKHDKLIYASSIGDSKMHGEENLENGIPESIASKIQKYFPKY